MGSTILVDFFLDFLKGLCGEKCILCEQRINAEFLVFRHVDESTKVDTISNLRKKGILYVLRELPKCVILCASCHNRFTHTEKNDNKIDHILRIKQYHSLANRPGYLFGWPLNFIIEAVIVHKEADETLESKAEFTEEEFQAYLKWVTKLKSEEVQAYLKKLNEYTRFRCLAVQQRQLNRPEIR